MENIVRISSQQSSFNKTNNLVDIQIPANSGVYDLTEMFVTIDTRLHVVSEPTPADKAAQPDTTGLDADVAVQNVRLEFRHNPSGATASIYNAAATPVEILVRNASMISQAKGKIEDIRRADVLRATMKSYTQDLDDVQSVALTGAVPGAAKGNPWVLTRHAQLYGDGNVLSKEQNHEIRIYLRDIFEICKSADAYDSSIMGNTNFHFELNLDRLDTRQALGFTPTRGGDAWARKYHNLAANTDGPQAKYNEGAAIVFPTVLEASDPPILATTITMAAKYQCLEDSPFWVGQLVNLVLRIGGDTEAGSSGTTAPAVEAPGTSATAKWAVIKAITYDQATRQIELDFGATILTTTVITAPGTKGYQVQFEVTGVDVTSSAIEYDSVEMTAIRRTDVSSGPSQMQYSQFMAQSDQFSSLSSLNRTYYLPAQTTNCIIVMPALDQEGSDILGSARLQDYRFSIDGESVTNRAVQYMPVPDASSGAEDAKTEAGSAVHYDLISNTFMNMGKRYSSLQECVYDQVVDVNTPPSVSGGGVAGYPTLAACPRKRCYMLALPIPMKDSQTALNVELNGVFTGGNGQLQIYSYVTSSL